MPHEHPTVQKSRLPRYQLIDQLNFVQNNFFRKKKQVGLWQLLSVRAAPTFRPRQKGAEVECIIRRETTCTPLPFRRILFIYIFLFNFSQCRDGHYYSSHLVLADDYRRLGSFDAHVLLHDACRCPRGSRPLSGFRLERPA